MADQAHEQYVEMTFPGSATGEGRRTYDVTDAMRNPHSLAGWCDGDAQRVWSVFDEHIKVDEDGRSRTGHAPEPPPHLFKPRRVGAGGDLNDQCLRLQVIVFARRHEMVRTVRCMEAQETDTTSGVEHRPCACAPGTAAG